MSKEWKVGDCFLYTYPFRFTKLNSTVCTISNISEYENTDTLYRFWFEGHEFVASSKNMIPVPDSVRILLS